VITFSKILKMISNRVKRTFFGNEQKLFDINYSAALICAATGAYMVWKPGITALGTTGQIRG